ncbi:unnamed protein product [Mytilus edulis]|uniref:Uncharacterized protein n=1 Tax=Mytilus edulis TaxID=6550 RepID=A0A8S3QTF1_MYTED|nr:unnamed protein product [Mytilus edulis]
MKFFWGDSFDKSLRNLRSMLKNEKLEEYTQWNVPRTVEEPVYLDFDIEAQFLENDNIMADQLEQISNTLTKHLNGNGSYNSITATLLPICLDSEGNVYVTDLNTNTVVVVSADGRQYREILTESNGLNCPRGIYFEKPENVLVVCNRQDGQAFLFDVKETNVNDEHFILE